MSRSTVFVSTTALALAALVTLALVALHGHVEAASELPLTATDPSNGRAVAIAPGAAALHVVVFATWCPPCVDELDPLAQLEARYGELGYRLIIVGVAKRQSAERLASFIDTDQPPGTVLFDSDGSVQKALGASELPAHFVFDSRGALVLRAGSLDDGVADAVRKLVGR